MVYIGAGVVAAAAITTGALAASGVFSGPGTFTVHGMISNSSPFQIDNTSAPNTWVAVSGHPGKCLDSETVSVMATVGGRDVAVASGHTSGDGAEIGDASFGECDSTFTLRDVPGGYASYGFQIQGINGTVNMTRAQIAKGVGLSIGS